MKKMTLWAAFALVLTGCGGGGIGVRSAGNTSMHFKAGKDITVNVSRTDASVEAAKSVDAGKIQAAANVAATGQGAAESAGNPSAVQPAPTAEAPVAPPAAPESATEASTP